MAHVRHDMRLAKRGKDGKSARDHYQAAASKGSHEARKELRKHPCPEALRYLVEYTWQLYGRSGTGMEGPEPLKPTELTAWARGMGIGLAPYEFSSLLLLDLAIRTPGEGEAEPSEVAQARPTARPQWPKRAGTAPETKG